MSKEATTAFDRAFHTAMPLGWAEDAAPSNLMCMPVPAASRGPRIPPWTFSLFISPPPLSARQANESTVDTFSTLIVLILSIPSRLLSLYTSPIFHILGCDVIVDRTTGASKTRQATRRAHLGRELREPPSRLCWPLPTTAQANGPLSTTVNCCQTHLGACG